MVRNPVQAALQSNKRLKAYHFFTLFFIFLAWHDPATQGVHELILDLFKVHSWLTDGWKSVRFWWYFHTFDENGDEVLLKIRLQTPIKTIFGAILFMYLLTNTNIARGEISSNLYRASVCDMKKITFFVNKFIPNFVFHTLNYLVWDDKEYIGQAPRPFMTPD